MRKTASCFAVGTVAFLLIASVGCEPQPVVRERVVYREPPPPPPVYQPAPQEATAADVDVFRDDLAPYGQWIDTPEYGLVWMPAAVAPDWRPYTVGQWAYTTEYGWTWVSDEPWGWATYHYGRWALIERRGWCWVPAREWGPGWVAWRSGGGYIGWAPLPPRRVGNRLSFDVQVSDVDVRNIPANRFCFVDERFITEHRVFEHAVPVTRNVTIINATQNVTKYERVNNHIVNRSVDVQHVERITGRTVQRYNISESSSARTSEIRGNQIAMHRAAVVQSLPQDRRIMEQRQQRARLEMEDRHRREMQAAPPERRPEISAGHERERAAFEEQARRESAAAQQRGRPEGRER